jgi:hypothetical protein
MGGPNTYGTLLTGTGSLLSRRQLMTINSQSTGTIEKVVCAFNSDIFIKVG